jgi:hypothetical protein
VATKTAGWDIEDEDEDSEDDFEFGTPKEAAQANHYEEPAEEEPKIIEANPDGGSRGGDDFRRDNREGGYRRDDRRGGEGGYNQHREEGGYPRRGGEGGYDRGQKRGDY